MKKSFKVKVTTKEPSNKPFFNLFYPIIPIITTLGIVAQLVSGFTESFMIYNIVSNELDGLPVWVVFLVSSISVILIVAVLELGTRKFLQVLTRVVVRGQFKTIWHKVLFATVLLITISLLFLSFRLSTKPVKLAFVSENTPFNTTLLDENLQRNLSNVKTEFMKRTNSMKESNLLIVKATEERYNTMIDESNVQLSKYRKKVANGLKWATSHVTKYKEKIARLQRAKAKKLESIAKVHTTNLEQLHSEELQQLSSEKMKHKNNINTAYETHYEWQKVKADKRHFYGMLLSCLIGACVILAYLSIIIVEIFTRGSEMDLQYEEIEKRPNLIRELFKKLDNNFYDLIANRITPPVPVATRRIGFRTNPTTPSIVNNTTSTGSGLNPVATTINDVEIIQMAIKNAKSYISAYKSKSDTANNKKRLQEWNDKLSQLQVLEQQQLAGLKN